MSISIYIIGICTGITLCVVAAIALAMVNFRQYLPIALKLLQTYVLSRQAHPRATTSETISDNVECLTTTFRIRCYYRGKTYHLHIPRIQEWITFTLKARKGSEYEELQLLPGSPLLVRPVDLGADAVEILHPEGDVFNIDGHAYAKLKYD
jgi:hypothetical protein